MSIPPATSWFAALLPTENDRLRRALALAALLGVLGKLTFGMLVVSHNPGAVFESSDSHEYHRLALNLLRDGSFSQSLSSPLEPETIRTPAYPVLLSGLYRVIGIHPNAVVAIQIALSLVTMLAGCRIAVLVFGQRAALLTGIFLALDPLSLYYSQVMLTETLFGTALTLSLLGMVYASRHPSLLYPCWTGICLALATYTRPTGYYFGILIPVGFLLAIGRLKGWRQALASAALMWLLFAVPVAGWQVRNYVFTGSAEFSQAKNQYLLIAKAAAIVAMRDGLTLQEAQQWLAEQHAASMAPEVPRSSQTALLESQGRFAQAIVAAHPVLLIRTTLQGTAANLFGPSNLAHLFGADNVALRDAFLQQDFARFPLRDWITALSSWTFGLTFLGALYRGVWLLLKQNERWNGEIALLVLTAAYVILVSSGPEAYSRFRMPVMPIFCILAAGGYLCRLERTLGEHGGDALVAAPDPPEVGLAVRRHT
jgi:4-amino-4-deoxy-L-arabinose transferase-like glycosyltransferase